MPSKPVFLVSDIHLGAVPPATEVAFRRWLTHVKESASRLIINGDLFDFWFEYKRVVPGEHVRVLALLADLVESGVPVVLMGGNHDWWGGDFFESRLGMQFHQDPVRLDVHGRTVLVAHGDGVGSGDLGYRALRTFLRGRLTRWVFRWIHPDVGAGIADRVSATEERAGDLNGRNQGRSRFLQNWATETLHADPSLHMVALGHTHTPTIVEVDEGRYYVNSGDWVRHRSYVTIDENGTPTLHDWAG